MVNMLKERINNNLQIIKKNEEIVRKIMLLPVSNERSELLKENFDINRKLLDENHDSLIIELKLINYLGKFREALKHQTNMNQSSQTGDDNEASENDRLMIESSHELKENSNDNEILDSTILGEIPFNSNHPKFFDEEFFEVLFETHKHNENYEMCSHLLKIKRKK